MMESNKEHDKVEGSMTLSKWHAYSRLMRIDKLLLVHYYSCAKRIGHYGLQLKAHQVYIF